MHKTLGGDGMKIHHLNCGTMKISKILSAGRIPDHAVCHCLLIETRQGLVLIDSGIGTRDMVDPSRLGPTHYLLPVREDMDETALNQVLSLGYKTDDVRHIILTHLDLDHTGGIPDFPHAAIHVLLDEYRAAHNPSGFKEKNRYRKVHLAAAKSWETYEERPGDEWFGFPCIKGLTGLPEEIILVPLRGHTKGHCGVAVASGNGWLLHAGDAYYSARDMAPDPHCQLPFKLFEYLVHMDHSRAVLLKKRLWNLAYRSGAPVRVFCTHDPGEFEWFRLHAQA